MPRKSALSFSSVKSVALILFTVLITISSHLADAAWTPGKLEIHLFDVGQADSQLIISPTGKTILIDAGETNWNGSRNSVSIGNKIHQIMGTSFSHLDYIITTHLHTDHIGTAGYGSKTGYGGIWNLIEKQGFTVGKLIDRDSGLWVDNNHDGICDPATEIVWHNAGTTSGTSGKWLCYVTDPANAGKLHRETATVGSTTQIDLGAGITVKIIEADAKNVKLKDGVTSVQGDHTGNTPPPSENDYSITVKITYNDFDYVTGGDTDGQYATSSFSPPYVYNDVESVIAPLIGNVDVLKVNHHGSSHSSNQTFLNALQQKVAMISCGATNTYGHPDQAVLDRLLNSGKVYLTEKCDPSRNYGSSIIANGDIVVSTSDGITFTVNGDTYSATDIAATAATAAPTVTKLSVMIIPTSFSTRKVKIAAFTATDADSPVTGYKLTESPVKPSTSATGWTSSPPKTYKIRSLSTRALYGWAKDAAGNVSDGRLAEVWFQQ